MNCKIIVGVQKTDFDLNLEMEALKLKTKKAGAVVFFVGKVRDLEDDKLQYLEIESFEELAKNAGWTQKESEKNLKLLEKYWLNYLEDGSLLRKNGRYFLSDPRGMQISNQVLIQMFLWWDSLNLD